MSTSPEHTRDSNDLTKWRCFAETYPVDAEARFKALEELNEELSKKTVLVGGGLTASEADEIVLSAIHSSVIGLSDYDKKKLPHLMRWIGYIQEIDNLSKLFEPITVDKATKLPRVVDQLLNKICAICLDGLSTREWIVVPPCKHWLHSTCFTEYAKHQSPIEHQFPIECPVDRSNISDHKLVIVDWDLGVADDDDGVATVGEVGFGGVGMAVSNLDGKCSGCRVLYVAGVDVITCVGCSYTYCAECATPSCLVCDGGQFATHIAMDDDQGVVPDGGAAQTAGLAPSNDSDDSEIFVIELE